MNIFKHALRTTNFGILQPWAQNSYRPIRLFSRNIGMFSEYFRKKDQEDIIDWLRKKSHNKAYRGIIDQWKRPLAKKKIRQERIK